jgi:hypothetical protein
LEVGVKNVLMDEGGSVANLAAKKLLTNNSFFDSFLTYNYGYKGGVLYPYIYLKSIYKQYKTKINIKN